jgi:hypothetical protein
MSRYHLTQEIEPGNLLYQRRLTMWAVRDTKTDEEVFIGDYDEAYERVSALNEAWRAGADD